MICKNSLFFKDLFPIDENGYEKTKDFLLKIIDICLEFIRKSNDRSTKVLDFHQPDELQKLFDFSIPEEPLDIQQVINDCRETLKYQVKTGEYLFN